jgi:hypothetical protein
MTLFFLIGIPLLIFLIVLSLQEDTPCFLLFGFYLLFFVFYSDMRSKDHYELSTKPVEIQKLIQKGEQQAFVLYKVEGEEEERAETVEIKLVNKPSYLEITTPKESDWTFWNMAPNTEELKISKEDFKKFL